MSRKEKFYDNSIIQNFFGILKKEIYYGKTFYIYEELAGAIEKFITYYNENRIKETLDQMSPVEYRIQNWDKQKTQISLC